MKLFIICAVLQVICFYPFYRIWKQDCEELGEENLAVSLGERFMAWLLGCPIWMISFVPYF